MVMETTNYEDRPTRIEAEREHREDLLAWAEEHAPELLPDPDVRDDPDEWAGVWSAIESAQTAARWHAAHPEGVDYTCQTGDPF